MGGPDMAPQTPQRSEHPGEAVALLDTPTGSSLVTVRARALPAQPLVGEASEGPDEAPSDCVDQEPTAARGGDEPRSREPRDDAHPGSPHAHHPHAAPAAPGSLEPRGVPEHVARLGTGRAEGEHTSPSVQDHGTMPRVPFERSGVLQRALVDEQVVRPGAPGELEADPLYRAVAETRLSAAATEGSSASIEASTTNVATRVRHGVAPLTKAHTPDARAPAAKTRAEAPRSGWNSANDGSGAAWPAAALLRVAMSAAPRTDSRKSRPSLAQRSAQASASAAKTPA